MPKHRQSIIVFTKISTRYLGTGVVDVKSFSGESTQNI